MGREKETEVSGISKPDALNRMSDFIQGRIPKGSVTGREDWFRRANAALQKMAWEWLSKFGLPNNLADREDVIHDTYLKVQLFRPINPCIRANWKEFMKQVVLARKDKYREQPCPGKPEADVDESNDDEMLSELRFSNLKDIADQFRGRFSQLESPFDATYKDQISRIIKECLERVAPTDHKILALLRENYTQTEIAEILSQTGNPIDQRRVSERRRAALEQMRGCIEKATTPEEFNP
ncbi:MAG: hypothetical protein KJ558_07995 [Gammaproteobacteria bacterium]|nr:hypothetical protein [Gammaproteobacteria bacterium]MBU1654755.1 hypothetical protein [Gammaproteobacteria bacterium]MBU1961630.1 hypothetical protein [Gammaproteobacteria bacterium]